MKIFSNIHRITKYLESRSGSSIGFVPTMGALHSGHIELVRKARKENSLVAVSIFINPIQFNNPEDLRNYPRDTRNDLEMLNDAGCDLVFMPSAREMYPDKVTEAYDFGQLDKVMEGLHRPGHFNGVAVVVRKLFGIVKPGRAYFGEKDYQQLIIIKAMVRMARLPVEIIPCPTVRESDGLAMSSRNRRLSPEHRLQAPIIFQLLSDARQMCGKESPQAIREYVASRFATIPGFRLEYFEIADPDTLVPVTQWNQSRPSIACIAAYAGNIRLIDNMQLIS